MQFKFNFIINIHFFQKEKRRSNGNNSAFWPLEQKKIAIFPNPGSRDYCKPMNVIQTISQGGLTSGKAAKPTKRELIKFVVTFRCLSGYVDRSCKKYQNFHELNASGHIFFLIFLIYGYVEGHEYKMTKWLSNQTAILINCPLHRRISLCAPFTFDIIVALCSDRFKPIPASR